jgi:MarR family transcriptional regulator, 2-MHQ and catechol-resistance regulon repressor
VARERFLRTLRRLAECYQGFERFSAMHVRELGLTPSQFDIIATLGNTEGMTFKELGEQTLITKGTLTGVVDRMAARGLVERIAVENDRRSMLVRLTRQGEAEFTRVFDAHISHLKRAFGRLSKLELDQLENILGKLEARFVRPRESER